jgi:hypothetical protein
MVYPLRPIFPVPRDLLLRQPQWQIVGMLLSLWRERYVQRRR